ncbi:MAG: peptidyl-prolyl cis-trans isomerase [Bacteroidota bacterium]
MALTKHLLIGLFAGLWILTGCEYLQVSSPDPVVEPEINPIARAHNAFLYPQDVEGIVKPNTSTEDSAAIMNRFVNAWIQKQLMLQEAASKIDFDEAEIERKILDYRYALMVYEYQKYYVEQTLNEEVSSEEIDTYYQENEDNFRLKQNIVQGKFVRLTKAAPQQERFIQVFQTDLPADQEEINSYCFRFAESYTLDDTTWVNFNEMVKSSPWNSLEDRASFLQDNTFVQGEDEDYYYFLHLKGFQLSGQLAPLDFVREQIRQIIINRRKVELTNQLEDDVFQRAVETNDFEIFSYE